MCVFTSTRRGGVDNYDTSLYESLLRIGRKFRIAILLGTRQRSHSYRDVTSLDSNLTFDKHVSALSKTCFYHIRGFRHIRPAINENMAKSVACSLVRSRVRELGHPVGCVETQYSSAAAYSEKCCSCGRWCELTNNRHTSTASLAADRT
jgi:hypothetical protein